MKAVILAGDEGKRLKPLTCTVPKAMLPLLGRPIIDYILDLLIENGFDEIYVVLNYSGDCVRRHIVSQNRKEKLHFVFEGQLKNSEEGIGSALKKSREPFLIIDGGTLCDYRLDRIMKYHIANDCAATVVTSKTSEPENYGVVCTEQDGRIKCFIENPSFTQAVSNNADTGICVLNPECIDFLSDNYADITAGDAFSYMVKEKMRIFAYPAEGYWCNINDFDSYRQCQCDMLDGKANIRIPSTYKNIITKSESNIRILPPSYIGKNVIVGKNAVIGPYTVIGDGCKIDDNAKLHGAIIGKENYIGRTVKINGAITGSNCSFLKNVSVFENCVLGDKVSVGSDSVISANVRIWPQKNIQGGVTVSDNIKYTSSKSTLFNENCIKGTGGIELSPDRCSLIGAALGSTSVGKKVGIAHDGKPLSKAMLMCVAGGLLSVGSRVWSFEDCLIPQLYFYTSYCSLDCGVYASSKGDDVKITLFSAGGLSVSSAVRREIERRITDRTFLVCNGKQCKNIADMSGVGLMYQRELLNQCRGGLEGMRVSIECENDRIKMLLNDVLHRLGGKNGGETVFTVSPDGLSLTAKGVQGETMGTETLLAICCMFEAMSGNDIAVPFDAPAVIDAVAEKYNHKAFRYLSAPSVKEDKKTFELASSQLWARDGLFLCFRLLGIMQSTGMSLDELKGSLPKYNTVRRTVGSTVPFCELYKVFGSLSPSIGTGGEGIEIRLDNARAVILPLAGGKSLKIIAESVNSETAQSLCDDIIERLKKDDTFLDNV